MSRWREYRQRAFTRRTPHAADGRFIRGLRPPLPHGAWPLFALAVLAIVAVIFGFHTLTP